MSQNYIEDTFGKKIGGSVRDIRRQFDSGDFSLDGYTERDMIELKATAIKARLWQEPDWKNMPEDKSKTILVRLLRDSLPQKCPTGVSLEHYISLVTNAKKGAEKYLSGEIPWVFEEVLKDHDKEAKKSCIHFTISNSIRTKIFSSFSRKGLEKSILIANWSDWPNNQESPFLKGYELYISPWDKNEIFLIKGRTIIKKGFESVQDCIDYANNFLDQDLKNKKKKKKNENTDPVRPMLDGIKRVGIDYGDVTPEIFQETFHFRGGEFGTWLTQEDRQQSLNLAYASFMDLSKLLNIDPKMIGQGKLSFAFGARGKKHAAHYESTKMVINLTKFRGAGALAHEWGHFIDHLHSKTESLWFSEIDNKWMTTKTLTIEEAKLAQEKAVRKTTDNLISWTMEHKKYYQKLFENLDIHSQEYEKAYKAIVKKYAGGASNKRAFFNNFGYHMQLDHYTIAKSNFLENAEELDQNKSKKYWSTSEELFARAFESYVQHLMRENGIENTYLVSPYVHPNISAYPNEEEMPKIIKNMERIMKSMFNISQRETTAPTL